jgi:hypothetical protein
LNRPGIAYWIELYQVYTKDIRRLAGGTLQKWGNSIGVRLPKPVLEQVGLKEGTTRRCCGGRRPSGDPKKAVEACGFSGAVQPEKSA